MTNEIRDDLPSGFQYADRLQVASFAATGSINGASKVCLVLADSETIDAERNLLQSQGPDEFPTGYYQHLAEMNTARLATRLRPPYDRPGYAAQYREGWMAHSSGRSESQAFTDGFRDKQENRMKWHLAYCESHGDHPEGCHA